MRNNIYEVETNTIFELISFVFKKFCKFVICFIFGSLTQ